jgi:hypothetical protein
VASNRDITLSIKHGANSAETYALYGEDCRLILPSNATKRRYLNAVTTWLRGYLKNEYWENSIIEWRVPKGNSNLRFPSSLVTTTQDEDTLVNITVTETDTYTACSYPFVYKKQIDDKNFEWVVASDIFYYNLKENYNPRATAEDNTITCIITSVKNEFAPLTASVRFNFSAIGNSGTEYTITISPKVGDYVFTTGDSIAGDSQLFSYTLSDPSGKIVNDAQFYHNIPATFSIDAYNTVEAFVYVTWAGRRVQLSYEYPVQFSKNGEYSANAPIKVSYNAEGRLNN